MTLVAGVPRRRGVPELWLPEGHDLLTDEADWDADTWDMDAAGLERLAQTLEWLFERIPMELTFEALWGDDPEEVRVSREELLELVRANRIGTRARYCVAAAARG